MLVGGLSGSLSAEAAAQIGSASFGFFGIAAIFLHLGSESDAVDQQVLALEIRRLEREHADLLARQVDAARHEILTSHLIIIGRSLKALDKRPRRTAMAAGVARVVTSAALLRSRR